MAELKYIISLALLLFCAVTEACYQNQQLCYTPFSVADKNASDYCSVVDTAQTCFNNDMAGCTGSIPSNYLNQWSEVSAAYSQCSQECFNKAQVCNDRATDISSYSDFTTLNMTNFCGLYHKALACYQSIQDNCSRYAPSVRDLEFQYSHKAPFCSHPSCFPTFEECYGKIRSMSASQQNSTTYASICTSVNTVITCYNALLNTCPVMQNTISQELQEYQQARDLYCSCDMTKISNCQQPMLQNSCSGTIPVSLTGGNIATAFKCCGYQKQFVSCVQDVECDTLSPLIISSLSNSATCVGYTDYCPGLEECIPCPASGEYFLQICSNLESMMSCVETKCAGKPPLKGPSIAQIKNVVNEICQGLNKHQLVLGCTSFYDCASLSPALPGTNDFSSIISARDGERWCKISKNYMNCAKKEVRDNSCNLGNTFATDIDTITATVDGVCQGVREVCPEAAPCLNFFRPTNNVTGPFSASGSMLSACSKIPSFTTCVDNALTTCGDGSKVQAPYTLGAISNLYSEFCEVPNTDLSECTTIQRCFVGDLVSSDVGDRLDSYTDQRYWCKYLRDITKCLSESGSSCSSLQQSQLGEVKNIYQKTIQFCPDTSNNNLGGSFDDTSNNNLGVTFKGNVVSTTILILTSFILYF